MIDFCWTQYSTKAEIIDAEWCEPCKVFHVKDDHKIEPVEPEIKETKIAGLLENSIG